MMLFEINFWTTAQTLLTHGFGQRGLTSATNLQKVKGLYEYPLRRGGCLAKELPQISLVSVGAVSFKPGVSFTGEPGEMTSAAPHTPEFSMNGLRIKLIWDSRNAFVFVGFVFQCE